MPKKAKELSALAVQRLKTPGLHAVGVIDGLHLRVLSSGVKTWILRVSIAGKRRDMGLGGFPAVPLTVAREKAREAREAIKSGVDPIAERARAQSALAAARGADITFDKCARQFIEAKAHEWKNSKHTAQWTATIDTYASPIIGGLQVKDVGLPHIIKVLEPIWHTKTETASRLRGRLEAVLDWATVRGYRHGTNPARWKGYLDKVLPSPGKIAKVVHHAALPIDQMGQFICDLRKRNGIAARALEFTILTAARSGEVRSATWSEIDLKSGTWVIPGARMKAGREHRVPLSEDALLVLSGIPRMSDTDITFPAPRGGVLSDMSLTAVMRRMEVNAVPHGFRSTFRDWAAERTNYPRDVAEMALAHAIGNKVEAAYRRGDLFEKRRKMMTDWAKHCGLISTPDNEAFLQGVKA
ncbi:tyrosine-type recombinase/integrase [Eoetvoesiella caeni]